MCPFISYSSWPMVCRLPKYPQIILYPCIVLGDLIDSNYNSISTYILNDFNPKCTLRIEISRRVSNSALDVCMTLSDCILKPVFTLVHKWVHLYLCCMRILLCLTFILIYNYLCRFVSCLWWNIWLCLYIFKCIVCMWIHVHIHDAHKCIYV